MRRLILQMQMSLDGFAGGPNGELDWIFPGFGSDATGWIVDRLWQAGAHLMGGATYRDMAAHWPTSSEPAAAPMNQTPKLVLSRSLRDAPWGETRIVAGDVATEVARQKQECGRDLLAHEVGTTRFRLIGIGVSNLEEVEGNELADLIDRRAAEAEHAVDRLRSRFGRNAVVKGLALDDE